MALRAAALTTSLQASAPALAALAQDAPRRDGGRRERPWPACDHLRRIRSCCSGAMQPEELCFRCSVFRIQTADMQK